MTTEQKQNIITKAIAYMQEKNLSANELSRQSDINAGYLSAMLNNKFTVIVKEKPVEIADKWFIQLAAYIGISIQKTYWETQETTQFIEIIAALIESKQTGNTSMIIAETGIGKTYAVDRFCNKMPLHTYRLTVSSMYKLLDIVNELSEKVNIDVQQLNYARMHTYSLKARVDKIIAKLREIKMNGGQPIVIFDEAENLEISVLKMIKALFDALKDYCSLVMIGTPQLLEKLTNKKASGGSARNRQPLPQLYRRFKAGQKNITPLLKERDFKSFFDKYVADKGLRTLLIARCDNYGELHDFLEPVMREADRKQVSLTEELFRLYHNIPKLKIAQDGNEK